MAPTIERLYRYESQRYSVVVDADADIYGVSPAKLCLQNYEVVAETPKGYWVGFFGAKDKWVSKSSRKRFAHPTESEALEAYRIRKKAYVRHATSTLQRAKEDLALAVENQSPF